jgi:uncharacterized membrane protein
MNSLPDIWRVELWHPLTVHFPIALLIGATLTRLASRFWDAISNWIVKMSRVLLFGGTMFAWIAVYTGSLADAEVVRSLCDPTVLESHENISYSVGWIFTAAVLLDVIYMFKPGVLETIKTSWKEWILIGLLLVGTGFLTYSSHLGVRLVYQQAAGVYHPAEDCRNFE